MSAAVFERFAIPFDASGESLPEELADAVNELRALPLTELRIRMRICRIASLFVRLTDGRQGHAAAAAMGVSRTTLHRWVLVSRCFDDGFIDELIARRDCSGRAISFWHLVELSRVPRPKRAALLDAVFTECLSVAQLRQRVRQACNRKP